MIVLLVHAAGVCGGLLIQEPKVFHSFLSFIIGSMLFIWALGSYVGFIGPVSEKTEEILERLKRVEEMLEENGKESDVNP
jgi:hypothetical protein